MILPDGVRDAGAFLARLLTLDPKSLVRLHPAGRDRVDLWARLPFDVLVTRRVAARLDEDVTVRAGELFEALGEPLPTRHDAEWRGQLPRDRGRVLDVVPPDDLRRVATAAADTVRAAAERGVGERALRDTLLDHVAITVTSEEDKADIPVRMVQALVRMGFLGVDPVAIRRGGRWIGAEATYGSAWLPPAPTLAVTPTSRRPIG